MLFRSLAHRERAPVEHLPVESLDRVLRVRAIGEFDERESPRTAGLAVDWQHHLRGRRNRSEICPEIRFGRALRQIANEQTDSQSTLP